MSGSQTTRAMAMPRRAPLSGTALLSALLLAAAAHAQAPAAPYDPQTAFRQTDTNRDGAVDHAEFESRMAEVFFHADVDKDGRLTAQEAVVTLVQTAPLAAADSNGDGTLSMHEFSRARHQDFERADSDADGLLQLDEVVGAMQPTQ